MTSCTSTTFGAAPIAVPFNPNHFLEVRANAVKLACRRSTWSAFVDDLPAESSWRTILNPITANRGSDGCLLVDTHGPSLARALDFYRDGKLAPGLSHGDVAGVRRLASTKRLDLPRLRRECERYATREHKRSEGERSASANYAWGDELNADASLEPQHARILRGKAVRYYWRAGQLDPDWSAACAHYKQQAERDPRSSFYAERWRAACRDATAVSAHPTHARAPQQLPPPAAPAPLPRPPMPESGALRSDLHSQRLVPLQVLAPQVPPPVIVPDLALAPRVQPRPALAPEVPNSAVAGQTLLLRGSSVPAQQPLHDAVALGNEAPSTAVALRCAQMLPPPAKRLRPTDLQPATLSTSWAGPNLLPSGGHTVAAVTSAAVGATATPPWMPNGFAATDVAASAPQGALPTPAPTEQASAAPILPSPSPQLADLLPEDFVLEGGFLDDLLDFGGA